MDSQVAISLGTAVALITFVYQWHKDSKETAKQIQKLETEVAQLREQRQDIRDLKSELIDLREDMGSMKQTLTRVDTNIAHLMQQNG
jgi:cell shape-determining protein MreC